MQGETTGPTSQQRSAGSRKQRAPLLTLSRKRCPRQAPDSTREHQTQHQAVPIPTPPGTPPPQDFYEYLSSKQPICVSLVLTKLRSQRNTLMKSAVHLLASGHNLGGGMHLQTARPPRISLCSSRFGIHNKPPRVVSLSLSHTFSAKYPRSLLAR